MNHIVKKASLIGAALLLSVTACEIEDLEVENLNTPNRDQVLSTPEDYSSLVRGAWVGWWRRNQQDQPQMPLAVVAETMTSSWGNWGMRDVGTIPRIGLENSQVWPNRSMYETPWFGYNGDLVNVNLVQGFINDGVVITNESGNDITRAVEANVKVLQGLLLGHLGLLFDQAYAADENTDVTAVEFSDYQTVLALAVSKLEEGIQLCNSNTFSDLGYVPGETFDNTGLAKFANSYIARLLAYGSRNASETAQVDWNRVLTHARAGIDDDFAPLGDGGIQWWDRIKVQGQDAVWARVAQRVINSMAPGDPNAVYPWPDGVGQLDPVSSQDARLESDMTYAGAPAFIPARGYYFFSSYQYTRYADYRQSFATPMASFVVAENDLLLAEALVRTGGSKSEAAQLINNTRVGRGGLDPISAGASDQQLLDAIMYERAIELGWTHSPIGFYDKRRTDSFRENANTFRHFPVPALELDLLGLPVYTFP